MLKENDTVRFTYLKEFKDEYKGGQVLTDYTDQSVELADGDIKSFYEGRMVGTEVLPETKRELFSLIASALFKGKTQTAS